MGWVMILDNPSKSTKITTASSVLIHCTCCTCTANDCSGVQPNGGMLLYCTVHDIPKLLNS